MKVLHLIDPGSPGGGGCSLRLLAEAKERLRSVTQDVLILGTRAHADLAARCGVAITGVISPPLGQAPLARRGLRRVMEVRESIEGAYDIIHAWTVSSAMLATMVAPRRKRLATLSVGPVGGLETFLLMTLLEHRPMPLLTSSSAVLREYLSMGVREDLMSVLPPAVNPHSVDREQRDDIRRRWKIEEGDEAFVVGLLSEPGTWADARTAVEVATRVCATGRPVRLVLHHGAMRRVEAQRWAEQVGFGDILTIVDEVAEPWRVVSGLDAALLIGGELNSVDLAGSGSPFSLITGGGRRLRPMPGIMPLLWAMSAGVPVIAEASDAVRDIVEDGVTGLLVEQYDIDAAADRIIRICDDRTIAGRIGTQARSLVRDEYNVSTWCVRLKEIYRSLQGDQPVHVIAQAPDALEVEDLHFQATA